MCPCSSRSRSSTRRCSSCHLPHSRNSTCPCSSHSSTRRSSSCHLPHSRSSTCLRSSHSSTRRCSSCHLPHSCSSTCRYSSHSSIGRCRHRHPRRSRSSHSNNTHNTHRYGMPPSSTCRRITLPSHTCRYHIPRSRRRSPIRPWIMSPLRWPNSQWQWNVVRMLSRRS